MVKCPTQAIHSSRMRHNVRRSRRNCFLTEKKAAQVQIMVEIQASGVCVSMAQGQGEQDRLGREVFALFLAFIIPPQSQMPLFSSLVKGGSASEETSIVHLDDASLISDVQWLPPSFSDPGSGAAPYFSGSQPPLLGFALSAVPRELCFYHCYQEIMPTRAKLGAQSTSIYSGATAGIGPPWPVS